MITKNDTHGEKIRAYVLEVPLDASQIEGFEPAQAVKVAAKDRAGHIYSHVTRLGREGKGAANIAFNHKPGALSIAVGPADVDDQSIFGMQTIRAAVPANRWKENQLTIPPLTISSYYWHIWPLWCRRFTIRGRLLCPDGSPVPGAKVCAYDVDWWWWWLSKQEVACDTTDATGSFSMTFIWCCGWWPWWWWRSRYWQLEPKLVERILPELQKVPEIRRIPTPIPKPDLAVFDDLLRAGNEPARVQSADVTPVGLDHLRLELAQRLPRAPHLEALKIWPWWPFRPWWDCTPDIVFKATQPCEGIDKVIVDEHFFDARWNIPTNLSVTLVANQAACCIDPDDQTPEGNCMVITHACDNQVNTIGGNPGAAAAPEGYVNPGVVNIGGDRPYAGSIPISGLFGDGANADYYEFQWATAPAGPWNDMSAASAGGFTRWYWGPQLGGGPVGFHHVPFVPTPIDGRNVIETREHFEAGHDPASWGFTRFWTSNRYRLLTWHTKDLMADGTYYLRVRSWDLSGTTLINSRILPLCDTKDDNGLVLTIDNRPDPSPGMGHGPCGPGTIHVCTFEPSTDFISVRINGTSVDVCTNVDVKDGGFLDIDFLAHDPDGHLAYYSLIATYGENLAIDLLTVPGATLTPLFTGPVPAATQVGPTYADARSANPPPYGGATAPVWHGGAIRLHIPGWAQVFSEPCCYQLELRAYKRTIVSCDDSFVSHSNLSNFTFGVVA